MKCVITIALLTALAIAIAAGGCGGSDSGATDGGGSGTPKALGAACQVDDDCSSGHCGPKSTTDYSWACVKKCTADADCASASLFCMSGGCIDGSAEVTCCTCLEATGSKYAGGAAECAKRLMDGQTVTYPKASFSSCGSGVKGQPCQTLSSSGGGT
jgi:hypothetical protein